MERTSPQREERSKDAERKPAQPRVRPRSGEGSESALAKLRQIEKERARTSPSDGRPRD